MMLTAKSSTFSSSHRHARYSSCSLVRPCLFCTSIEWIKNRTSLYDDIERRYTGNKMLNGTVLGPSCVYQWPNFRFWFPCRKQHADTLRWRDYLLSSLLFYYIWTCMCLSIVCMSILLLDCVVLADGTPGTFCCIAVGLLVLSPRALLHCRVCRDVGYAPGL